MADTVAIQFVERLMQRVDDHTREIVAMHEGGVEVDSINVIIGDGASVIVAGVAAVLRVDFLSRITGAFLQEFDGTSGTVAVSVARAVGGPAPSWTTIGSVAITTTGRYAADESLGTWTDTYIDRGDYLRFSVTSAATITRVHVALRIRRLEP